ncbi:MAG: TolC family protein [Treponema sp.]|jgi:multidrug efflux system outer membrane protein|nr:TolC family protein [Treponema sp.]
MRRVPPWGLFVMILVYAFRGTAAQEGREQEGKPETLFLSPERAVELALDQSLNLQKSFIDLNTAGIAANNLWAEVFPDISLSGGVSYRTPLVTGTPFAAGGFGYTASAGLSLRLNPSLPRTMKIIDLTYRAQLLNYENARRQLEIQVSKTFFGLLAEKQNLAHLEEIRALAEQQFERNQTAFANGLIGQLVVLQSRLGAETARMNVSRAEAAYNVKLGEFLALLGLDRGMAALAGIVLEGKIEIARVEVDSEQLIRDHLGNRPDIVSQRQNIERLELARRQAVMNSRAPTLSLSAQWNGTGPGTSGLTGGFTDTLSGSLTLGIPIESWIPGTRGHQALGVAGAGVEKARLDLKDAESRAMQEIRSLAENLKASWDGIEIARLRVEIAERAYELTAGGFRNGTVEYLTLQEARNDMAEARQQVLEGELAYQTMILDLAAALNIDWKMLMRSIP